MVTQIKKRVSMGLAAAAAVMLLSLGVLMQVAFAANSISTTAPTSISLATNAGTGTGAYSTLSADIAFTPGAAGDLASGSVVSITAPTGWSFNPALNNALVVTYGAGAAGPAYATVTPTTISTTLSAGNTATGVAAVTFDTAGTNLVIRPDAATTATGNLMAQTTGGTPLASTSAGTITAQAATPTPTATATATPTATPTPTPTPTPTCGFTGTAPGSGSIALLVTSGTCNAAGLITALGTAGCTVESLAVLEGGVWKIHINGAPAIVNTPFPTSLPALTAFFVRCQA